MSEEAPSEVSEPVVDALAIGAEVEAAEQPGFLSAILGKMADAAGLDKPLKDMYEADQDTFLASASGISENVENYLHAGTGISLEALSKIMTIQEKMMLLVSNIVGEQVAKNLFFSRKDPMTREVVRERMKDSQKADGFRELQGNENHLIHDEPVTAFSLFTNAFETRGHESIPFNWLPSRVVLSVGEGMQKGFAFSVLKQLGKSYGYTVKFVEATPDLDPPGPKEVQILDPAGAVFINPDNSLNLELLDLWVGLKDDGSLMQWIASPEVLAAVLIRKGEFSPAEAMKQSGVLSDSPSKPFLESIPPQGTAAVEPEPEPEPEEPAIET